MTNNGLPAQRTPRTLRLLTYNVHSCIGTDRILDPSRVAGVIARSGADVIALQEVDVGRKRTALVDQAHTLATMLQMRAHFHPVLNVAEELYGDAILTALPTRLVKAQPLPSMGELRGAIWVEVDVDGSAVNIINTHLGLRGGERRLQAASLLGPQWLGHAACQSKPTILCGDFNAIPTSAAYRDIARHFDDARIRAGRRIRATFPSRMPLLRLDHIFVSKQIEVDNVETIAGPLSRAASDHLPVIATLRIQADSLPS